MNRCGGGAQGALDQSAELSSLPAGAQGQKFLLQVEPKDLVVPAGGSLLVNCSTNCPNPQLISLETFLPKKPAGNGPGWAAFWLSNVTIDSKVLCSGFCNGVQMTGSSNITVYRECMRLEVGLASGSGGGTWPRVWGSGP